MKKSIEERLADIESGITRLTKMQGCVLKVLLILHKKSALLERGERAITSIKEDIEPIHRDVDHALLFMFGMIAVMGVSVSMYSIYFVTQRLAFRVTSIGLGVFALFFGIYAFLQRRRVPSQLRGVEKILTQTVEDLESATKEMAAAEDDLEQALAEWKELVPDDLVSEHRNDALEFEDSPDRS